MKRYYFSLSIFDIMRSKGRRKDKRGRRKADKFSEPTAPSPQVMGGSPDGSSHPADMERKL